MKKSLNIVAMAVVLMVAQACVSKSDKANEESVTVETPVAKTEVVLTTAERRAKLENDIAVWEENKRVAIAELAKMTPTYTDAKGIVVFNKAEVEPMFSGGKEAMMKYLNDNIVFPLDAKDKGLEGAVFVDFVIGADGAVRDVVVTDATNEGVDQSFRNEAVRVVAGMPKWVPGRQHGKAVDVKYSLPVVFQIR
jgi:protein TonB